MSEPLGRQSATTVPKASLTLVQQALDFVDARAPIRTSVVEVAAALAVHTRTLNRAFHAVYGRSPRSILRARQFEIAEALVAGMKVDAAAAVMGVSRNAMYRLFRAEAGRTPRSAPPAFTADDGGYGTTRNTVSLDATATSPSGPMAPPTEPPAGAIAAARGCRTQRSSRERTELPSALSAG